MFAMASEVTSVKAKGPLVKMTKFEKLKAKVSQDPVVYIFLGLTVAALTGGLASLSRNNKKQSQIMMRARVFFQFCTVSALLGGVYYRAYQGNLIAPPAGLVTNDNRAFITDPNPDLAPPESQHESVDTAGAAARGR